MACKDGSCGVADNSNRTVIKSTPISHEITIGIERYFYEYSGWLNLMKDIFVNDFEMPRHKYEELRQEYLDTYAMHQMMLTEVARTIYTKEELSKYSILIDFGNDTLDLVEYK